MTATDELRRMLDERGVKWDGWGKTAYGRGTVYEGEHDTVWTADSGDVLSILCETTPEQAIEATLGRGTCKVVSSIRHDYEGGCGGTEYEHELSCGHKVWWADDDQPEWCPWCGRKVVE